MAVEIFHYDSIPQAALAAGMQFLLTKWTTLSAMSKLTLQAVTETTSFNVVDDASYMVTAGPDDFFYRFDRGAWLAAAETAQVGIYGQLVLCGEAKYVDDFEPRRARRVLNSHTDAQSTGI